MKRRDFLRQLAATTFALVTGACVLDAASPEPTTWRVKFRHGPAYHETLSTVTGTAAECRAYLDRCDVLAIVGIEPVSR